MRTMAMHLNPFNPLLFAGKFEQEEIARLSYRPLLASAADELSETDTVQALIIRNG